MASIPHRKMRFYLLSVLFMAVCTAHADYKDDIGYTKLLLELGGSMPTGAGVNVTQIEAPVTERGSDYRPNTSDPAFTGKTFTFPNSPVGASASSHATTVGSYFYGSGSMAPGISQVTVFDVNGWINNVIFANPPAASTGKVQNSSWVGTTEDANTDSLILARYDYQIHRDGIIAVVGVNNGASSVPNLLAAGYNSIAVGLSNGASSSSTTSATLTGLYGNPRQKPDLVVPTNATSWATAVVSSSAALLVSSAGGNASAVRPEVIRAMLMAGATKSGLGGTWTHTDTAPLDSTYGAGQLNIYNSYHIQQAGRFAGQITPVSLVGNTGWDLGTATSAAPEYYFFHLSTVSDFSAVLAWDITVTANFTWTSIGLSIADMDMFLYNASGFTVGSLIDQSISSDDNVELLWEEGLGPGDYALKITTSSTQQYGLAWQTVPEPSIWGLLGFGLIFVGFMVRRRRLAASPR
ncbi:MAG: PEP-CTERM sorting domain-containing protein [Chthoniobacterales bacterium]